MGCGVNMSKQPRQYAIAKESDEMEFPPSSPVWWLCIRRLDPKAPLAELFAEGVNAVEHMCSHMEKVFSGNASAKTLIPLDVKRYCFVKSISGYAAGRAASVALKCEPYEVTTVVQAEQDGCPMDRTGTPMPAKGRTHYGQIVIDMPVLFALVEDVARAPRCDLAPKGWRCKRMRGHEPPCAAEKIKGKKTRAKRKGRRIR